jgi:hypothetical protein
VVSPEPVTFTSLTAYGVPQPPDKLKVAVPSEPAGQVTLVVLNCVAIGVAAPITISF